MPPLLINGQNLPIYSYIVFPYKANGDLYEFIRKQSPLRNDYLSTRMRHYLCLEILNCVALLHGLGLAHMDLKLENFIINDDFSISLIDFGTLNFTN